MCLYLAIVILLKEPENPGRTREAGSAIWALTDVFSNFLTSVWILAHGKKYPQLSRRISQHQINKSKKQIEQKK